MTEKQKSHFLCNNTEIKAKAVNSYIKFGDVKYEKQKTLLTKEEKEELKKDCLADYWTYSQKGDLHAAVLLNEAIFLTQKAIMKKAVPKSEFDKMMDSCHKLEVKYNELVQYSAKQCTDLVNSIPKEKVNEVLDEMIKTRRKLIYNNKIAKGKEINARIWINEEIETLIDAKKLLLGEK